MANFFPMRRSSFNRWCVVAYVLALRCTFTHGLVISKGSRMPSSSSRFLGLRSTKNSGWNADDQALPEISNVLRDTFDKYLGALLTRGSIDTVGYYMLEFRDEVTQRWMVSFQDYRSQGFPDGNWQKYLAGMIELDQREVKVFMKPPQAAKSSFTGGRDVKLQYAYELQPRKIAHSILTAREGICEEVTKDLGCIKIENQQAAAFAENWLSNGREVAEKERRPARLSYLGGSTPLRERTFRECAVLITNLALDMVRSDLKAAGDTRGMKCIDDVLARLAQIKEELTDPVERVLADARGTQTLIEELYYVGLTEKVDSSSSSSQGIKSTNLRIAQSLLNARLALSYVACDLINEQNRECRQFYQEITDRGGFNRLLDSSPKVAIVDMAKLAEQEREEEEEWNRRIEKEKEKEKGEEESAAAAAREGLSSAIEAGEGAVQGGEASKKRGSRVSGASVEAGDEAEDNSSLEDVEFGSFGPILM